MRLAAPPLRLSLAVAVICALLAWIATAAVRSPPWLGATLAPDPATRRIQIKRITPGGPLAVALQGRKAEWLTGAAGVAVTDVDRIEEPDVLPTYAAIEAFLSRQHALASALGAGSVKLDVTDTAGAPFSVTVKPGRRPLDDLPALFWLQLMFGGGALFIGGWVWSLRPGDRAVQLFALTGLGLGIGTGAAAVYSSRELALDGPLFRVLSAANHGGGLLFGAAMVAVFCLYPRPMPKRSGPLLTLVAICTAFWIADTTRWAPSPLIGAYLPVVALSLAIAVLIGVQAWRSRRDPVASAGLRWLGVAVIAGIGGFVVANAAPALLGGPALAPQALMLGPFLLIYISLAMGLGRYGLFQLDRWAYRTLLYTVAALAVLAMDALLLTLLGLGRPAALSAAILLVGLAYLPVRDALWRRITARRRTSDDHLHRDIMETVFHASDAEREAAWRTLMQRLFAPLQIVSGGQAIDAPALSADGRDMTVPNVAARPGLVLRFARQGRTAFGTNDLALAAHAVRLLRQTETGREAYHRGAAEERLRIGRELDAEIGARLEAGLRKNDIFAARAVLRDALADVRTAISAISGERRTLGDVLADLRHETSTRLEGAGVVLEWPLINTGASELAAGDEKALRTALRDALTQTLPSTPAAVAVRLSLEPGAMCFRLIADDATLLDRTFAIVG